MRVTSCASSGHSARSRRPTSCSETRSAHKRIDVAEVPIDVVDLVFDRCRGRGRQRGRNRGREVAREPRSAFGADVDTQPSRVLAAGLERSAVAPLERLPGRRAAVERTAAGPALEHGRLDRGTTRGLDRERELAVLPGGNDAADDGRTLAHTAADDGSIRAAHPDTRDRLAAFPVDERGLAGTPEPAVAGELARRAAGSIDAQPAMRLLSRERRRGHWQYGCRNPTANDCADQNLPPLGFSGRSFHAIPPFLEEPWSCQEPCLGCSQACSVTSLRSGGVSDYIGS